MTYFSTFNNRIVTAKTIVIVNPNKDNLKHHLTVTVNIFLLINVKHEAMSNI
jgi:hypothetical protein